MCLGVSGCGYEISTGAAETSDAEPPELAQNSTAVGCVRGVRQREKDWRLCSGDKATGGRESMDQAV